MKLKLLFLLSLILVINCNKKSDSEEINNYLYENEMPNDFNFIINNGGIDSYDSKSMNLYREFTDSIYKIKIPIDLVEKQLIYKKYVDLDFQSFPTKFDYDEKSDVILEMPSFITSITILEKNKRKKVAFNLSDLKNELKDRDKALKYQELYNFIWNILKNHKEYKKIPKSDMHFM